VFDHIDKEPERVCVRECRDEESATEECEGGVIQNGRRIEARWVQLHPFIYSIHPFQRKSVRECAKCIFHIIYGQLGLTTRRE
jgi:hypothetical protein